MSGLTWRKTVKVGRRARVTVSPRGATGSVRLGPVTVNSRGRVSVRLGRGLSWRGGNR